MMNKLMKMALVCLASVTCAGSVSAADRDFCRCA